jgi:hypothetical protein
MTGWIGVDLDGTLAVYHDWQTNGYNIGDPIEPMGDRVHDWTAKGIEVRIITARVAACGQKNEWGTCDDQEFADGQRVLIQEWCQKHLGWTPVVTATKDMNMIELWDDRARRVETNTGREI